MSNQFAKTRCSKPLAVIGLETTGLNPAQDRITKITILRIEPSNAVTSYVQRIQVNQDSVDDLPFERDTSPRRGNPSFATVHRHIRSLLIGSNVVGYNLKRFTIAFLKAEFERVSADLPICRASLIDLEVAD